MARRLRPGVYREFRRLQMWAELNRVSREFAPRFAEVLMSPSPLLRFLRMDKIREQIDEGVPFMVPGVEGTPKPEGGSAG